MIILDAFVTTVYGSTISVELRREGYGMSDAFGNKRNPPGGRFRHGTLAVALADLRSDVDEGFDHVEANPPVHAYAHVITVAKSGGQHTSVKAALVAAALVAGVATPTLVQVYPGIYTELNPLVIADYVSVIAVGRHATTQIIASDPGAHVFVLGSHSDMYGVFTTGATDAGFAAYHSPLGTVGVDVHDCQYADCDVGWLVDSVGASNLLLRKMHVAAGTTTSCVHITAGASATVDGIQLSGSIVTNGVLCEGAGASVIIEPGALRGDGGSLVNALNVRDGAFAQCSGLGVRNAAVGVRIGANSSVLLTGGGFDQCANDAVLEDATSVLQASSVWMSSQSIEGATLGTVLGLVVSNTLGDAGTTVMGECHVGTRDNPSELVVGGGESYFTDVETYTGDAAEVGPFTRQSVAAQTAEGSTFVPFDSVAAGECLYIGSPYVFPGFKVLVDTALVVGAGEIVTEYWSGAAWTDVRNMSALTTTKGQFSTRVLERANSEHVRFDMDGVAGWALHTIEGHELYWCRLRIVTGVTSVGLLQQIKCHTDRWEGNGNGTTEWFGGARPTMTMPVGLKDLVGVDGAAPKSTDIVYSSTIKLVSKNNRLEPTVKDGLGAAFTLPESVDTSCALQFSVSVATPAIVGDVEIELVVSPHPAGTALVDTTPESSEFKVFTVPGATMVPHVLVFSVDVSALVPGDVLAFAIIRDADAANAADTLADNALITGLSVVGRRWK